MTLMTWRILATSSICLSAYVSCIGFVYGDFFIAVFPMLMSGIVMCKWIEINQATWRNE